VSTPVHERAEIEQAGDGIEADVAPPRRTRFSILEISRDVQVWKQAGVLEYVADAPALGRYVEPPSGIQQDDVIQHHPSGVRIEKPGDDVDEGALAAA